MVENALHPRHIVGRLAEALEDSPVVLLQGPRQSGKTTLVKTLCAPEGEREDTPSRYRYFSFDDDAIRVAAETDPSGFVADLPDRAVLDEVQRVPGIFLALKLTVDRNREAGRFLLTGSTNVLALPTLQDSLAGRLQVVQLYPLSQVELTHGESDGEGFIGALLTGDVQLLQAPRLGESLVERIVAGGYPPALTRPSGRRQHAWYRNYIAAQAQRDVGDISRIRGVEVLPRLLALMAANTAQLFSVNKHASHFELSNDTIGNYMTLLERVYLVETLPPWFSNRGKRLVKTPKLHMVDTGVAAALLDVSTAALRADRPLLGRLMETFVYQELRRQATWCEHPVSFHHYRDNDGYEVDVVLESEGKVAGVEVKASGTVTKSDFRGLRRLRAAAGERFAAGVVVYDGEAQVGFGDGMYAVPVRMLWERG